MHFSFTVVTVCALSILIAGIIAIFRFGQIKQVYYPFIYLTWITCITELLSLYLVLNHHHNIILYTIYSLVESLLLLWFFQKLEVFKRLMFSYVLAGLFLIVWFVESFVINSFGSQFTFCFNAIYGFVFVLLSVRVINGLLFTEKHLLKNPTFLICIALMIFFTYDVINRMFRWYGLNESESFVHNIEALQVIINLISNLIFALAIFFMRKKQPLIFRF